MVWLSANLECAFDGYNVTAGSYARLFYVQVDDQPAAEPVDVVVEESSLRDVGPDAGNDTATSADEEEVNCVFLLFTN